MGRSYTPTYRVEYRDQKGWHIEAWIAKDRGRPTKDNIKRWRDAMHESFKPGGVNEQVTELYGFLPHISKARIIHQREAAIVAEFTAPMFEVC